MNTLISFFSKDGSNTQNTKTTDLPRNYDIRMKVITLGDCCVGKSTFLRCLYRQAITDTLTDTPTPTSTPTPTPTPPRREIYEPTIGVDFGAINLNMTYYELYDSRQNSPAISRASHSHSHSHSHSYSHSQSVPTSQPQPQPQPRRTRNKDTDNIRIKAHIWDTAGQERFLSITRTYFKNTCGVLLMFDLSKKQTFTNLSKWLQVLKEEIDTKTIYITLVGNKSDLNEKREVSQIEINTFLQNNYNLYIEYHECSCLEQERPFYIIKKHLSGIFTRRDRIPVGIEYVNPDYNTNIITSEIIVSDDNVSLLNNEEKGTDRGTDTGIFSCLFKAFNRQNNK